MSNLFNKTLHKKPKKNAFNLSHDVKLSLKFGDLVPVLCEEVVPGDIFKGRSQMLMRLAPMTAPIMHNINAYIHYFYVPNRILWPSWERFITGDNEAIEPPWITLTDQDTANGTLPDYLGFPSSDAPTVAYDIQDNATRPEVQYNALPFAAYQKIWYEYYRDQNLEFPTSNPEDIELNNGMNTYQAQDDVHAIARIRKRNWLHDYFTSALPFAQKGPAAMIPLSDEIKMREPWSVGPSVARHFGTGNSLITGNINATTGYMNLESTGMVVDNAKNLQLDTSESSIENLRRAFRLQEWLERNARGGTRYIESILSHFGERVRDYRLERPEYIGGKKQRIQISEVLQTSETTEEGEPLATMAGHGISASNSGSYNYKCEEHGWIIGILSVMPNTAYYQGLHRKFGQRKDRLDYFWPTFAHLGEQGIKNKELVHNPFDYRGSEYLEEDFGYTPRYSEYRWGKSTVAGDYNTSLEFWHLARKFPTNPSLNKTFMRVAENENEDWTRIFAVEDGTDYLWAHINHDIKAIRPMPRYATPIT